MNEKIKKLEADIEKLLYDFTKETHLLVELELKPYWSDLKLIKYQPHIKVSSL